MKKIFFPFVLALFISATSLAAPPSPWIPCEDGDGYCIDVDHDGVVDFQLTADGDLIISDGSITSQSSGIAIPATGTLTEAMHQKGVVLNDSSLTGNTDVQLLALDYWTVFQYAVTTGTYGTSWKPPSGKQIVYNGDPLTANYELDLTSNKYDLFTWLNFYDGSNWFWICIPSRGYGQDGGAS